HNTDDTPHLTLVKVLVNDDGGTKQVSDWSLSAAGSSRSFSGTANTGAVTGKAVTAGGQYALAESGPSGYTGSAWSCDGGTQDGSKVTLALGANVTCTITNDDNAPHLKLVKVVVNDNGGTGTPADWTLSATSTGQNHSRDFAYAGDTNLFE